MWPRRRTAFCMARAEMIPHTLIRDADIDKFIRSIMKSHLAYSPCAMAIHLTAVDFMCLFRSRPFIPPAFGPSERRLVQALDGDSPISLEHVRIEKFIDYVCTCFVSLSSFDGVKSRRCVFLADAENKRVFRSQPSLSTFRLSRSGVAVYVCGQSISLFSF